MGLYGKNQASTAYQSFDKELEVKLNLKDKSLALEKDKKNGL